MVLKSSLSEYLRLFEKLRMDLIRYEGIIVDFIRPWVDKVCVGLDDRWVDEWLSVLL